MALDALFVVLDVSVCDELSKLRRSAEELAHEMAMLRRMTSMDEPGVYRPLMLQANLLKILERVRATRDGCECINILLHEGMLFCERTLSPEDSYYLTASDDIIPLTDYSRMTLVCTEETLCEQVLRIAASAELHIEHDTPSDGISLVNLDPSMV